MKEAQRNYYVDTVIGIAFLVAAVSALVFLVPIDWIDFSSSMTPTILGVDFGVWQTLHKWGGIVMLIGVVVHQLLHWKWIVAMTKKVLPRFQIAKAGTARSIPCRSGLMSEDREINQMNTLNQQPQMTLTRRNFLKAAGFTTAALMMPSIFAGSGYAANPGAASMATALRTRRTPMCW